MDHEEWFQSAMECSTKAEAGIWLGKEVKRWEEEYGKKPEEALRTIKSNLGYWAGYHTQKEATKVYELFGAVHPVFGTHDYHTKVSPEEAFALGVAWGKKIKDDD